MSALANLHRGVMFDMQPISRRVSLCGLTLLLASLAAPAGCSRPDSVPPRPVQQDPAADVRRETADNARLDQYVGSETCAECHSQQHESYLNTAHSRSLSLVDPDSEPPDGDFLHERSGRTYRTYRRDGQLRHRESLLTGDGESIAAADYAVKYLVGSGRHSRTYLSEIDGFLVESPITWYVSRGRWDVSPGYDVPVPLGFERAADLGCLFCHVGHVEQVDGSLHRVRFHELAIGCERCHGPGAEHVAAARSDPQRDDVLSSITNPAQLARTLVEDICAQCHLRGDATVYLPGMGPMDFRPGDPLTTVRVDFVVDSPNGQMKVVGHVEQMRLSRCYTESGELTCTTCHDMHAERQETSTVPFYRARCLDCHAADGCGLAPADQRRLEEQDNCLVCHMPQTETDIPHIAFTHHRIGVHSAQATVESTEHERPRLVPWQDVSALDPLLVRRSTGLAWLEFAARQPTESLFAFCYDEAMRSLEAVHRQGATDGDLEAALAQLSLHTDPPRAARFAEAALERDSLDAQSRVNALLVRALVALESGNPGRAVDALEELQTIRRFAADSILLGNALRPSDPNRALAELDSAARIQPFRADLASELADLLERTGHADRAAAHRRRAALIRQQTSVRVENPRNPFPPPER